jgi:ABC-type Na+ transport system ATPase subunit NatA
MYSLVVPLLNVVTASVISNSKLCCRSKDVLRACPQVREHLELFSALKGVPSPEIPEAVSSIVGQLELMDKVDAPAGSLSGGMKRKLQVAIALIGGSKVVFLDEPTSGKFCVIVKHSIKVVFCTCGQSRYC